MEDECLKELPGCLFLQEHNAKNKEVWATAKHSCHSQPTKRIFPKKLPYMTDTTCWCYTHLQDDQKAW